MAPGGDPLHVQRGRHLLPAAIAATVATLVGAITFVYGEAFWGGFASLVVVAGALLSHRVTAPMVHRLAAREERVSAILQTAIDAIITIDDRGCVESMNPAAEHMFGYPAGEVVGKNVSLLIPAPCGEENEGDVAVHRQTQEWEIVGFGREGTGRRRDGSTFPIELTVSQVELGKRRLFTGIVRDISERKSAEAAVRESEQRYRSAVETVGIVLVCLSANYRVLEWNSEAERVYGTTRAKALGKNYVETFLPESIRAGVVAEIDRVLSGMPARGYENVVRSEDGSERILLWNSTQLPLVDGNALGVITCGQDITEYSKLQSELKLKHEESLSRVGEMAAVVAHEVKNPLAAISAAIQVVGKQLPAGSSNSAIVAEVLSRIDGLSNTVSDLLFFARPHPPTLEPLPLHSVLEDTVALFRRDPGFARVEVDVREAVVSVEGDAELLKPAFLNLLINAAQAMDNTGTISVSITQSNSICILDVVDSGPGIPVEIRERIFEPFFTTKARGSGLGLATTQRVIQAHGGDVSVVCPEEGGTRVTVKLCRAAVSVVDRPG